MMSGIAGILTIDGSEPPEELLRQLSKNISHRGRDDHGITLQNGLGLIHHRLALDPIGAGHQPLCNESNLSLVTDCHLINTKLFRTQFKEKYEFKTTLDSEVIFPLYEKYGAEFTHHLNGMYAVALYDGHADELVLVRDISGIKPLYYLQTENYFFFASELKAIKNLDGVGGDIHHQARKEILQYGSTVGSQSIINPIKTVMPGQTLIIQKGEIIKEFRDHVFDDLRPSKFNLKRSIKEIPDIISESLTDLNISNTPTVCFLERSGDFLLSDLLHKTFGNKNQSIYLRFDETQSLDKETIKDKNIQTVTFEEKDLWRVLPFVAATLDEPTNIPERAFTYMLAKESRNSARIVYSALGTKVLNADLQQFKYAKMFKFLGGRLVPKRGTFQRLKECPLFLQSWRQNIDVFLKDIEMHKGLTRLQKSQILEFENRFVNQNIASYERITTSHGIEVRYPFLDRRLVRELISLPDSLKIHNGQTGFFFYELLRTRLPSLDLAKVCSARRNVLNTWLIDKSSRRSALVAHQDEIEAIFSRDFVRDVFTCKDENHINAAWTILMYALWHQAHIKGIKPIPDTLSFLSAKS